jgi:putative aldouronate transport system permease protein
MASGKPAAGKVPKSAGLLERMKRQRVKLLLLLPFLGYFILFKYVPIIGNIAAFEDFSYKKGVFGSALVGFKYFVYFFKSPDLLPVLRNTLVISVLGIVCNTVAAVVFALLVCELKNAPFKKTVQTISYLPNFISWVVIVGMAMTFLSIDTTGVVNAALMGLGVVKAPVNFLGNKDLYWPMVTVLGVWKSVGWNSIIYIAAITSLDKEMYESAVIDGAGKLRQIWYITLPSIRPTILILLIFALGYVLNAGIEPNLLLQNPMNLSRSEVLETYIANYGLRQFNYPYGTAVGLVKSVVGLGLVVVTNQISRKIFHMGVF